MADTVSVGCRLVHGLHLRVVDNDGRERRVTLAGAKESPIIGGAGTTPVPRDFWEAWLKTNRDASFMKSGLVFATKSDADTVQEGKIRARDKTGFEGADPKSVDRALAELQR